MHQHNGLKIPIYFCLLVILSIPLIVTNDIAFVFITGKNFTFRVIVEVLFALYLLLMLYDSKYQPTFSWILVSFSLFIFFGFISAITGVDPNFSFFGSYQRMDGIVTLVHLFIYFIVLSNVIKTQELWSRFFYASIAVAFIVASRGIIENNPSSTLGNYQFSAVYLFFNVFFLALLIIRSSTIRSRYILGCIGAILIFVMLYNGERGVLCAAICATIVSVGYILQHRQILYMKYYIIAFTLCLLLLFVFLTNLPAELINSKQGFMRYFNIGMYKEGINLRWKLWDMALKGFKDYPVFGWGSNNFSYVFNKYYNSFYCNYEMWMDRVHNNYLELLVTGGVLGFCTFLGFLFTPIISICTVGKKLFSVSERAILLGLMSGYLVLNVFYFDTITSSICFMTVLAFIHAHVSTPFPRWEIPKKYIPFTIMPLLLIATTSLVYYLTIPSLLAAREAMIATQTQNIKEKYLWIHQAWMRHGVGELEILEKINPIVQQLLASDAISPQEKLYVANQTRTELKQYIKNKPLDPRAYYFLITLSMVMNNFDKAKTTLAAVWLLTPNREYTMMLEGAVEFGMGHLDNARNLFKQSLCIKTSQVLYNQVNQTIEQQNNKV